MDILSASVPSPHDEAIAALNDEFRRSLAGGRAVLTNSVAALGKEQVAAVLDAVRTFDLRGLLA